MAYLETLAELQKVGHTLVSLILHQSLFLLRQPLFLGGDKVSESSIRRGLIDGCQNKIKSNSKKEVGPWARENPSLLQLRCHLVR